MKEETKRLLNEVNELLELLDQSTSLFCQRIGFIRAGQISKSKFIDCRIMPIIDEKIKHQANRVLKLLSK